MVKTGKGAAGFARLAVLAGALAVAAAAPAAAQLRSSILPSTRAAQLDPADGATVTFFATLINNSDQARANCRVELSQPGLALSYSRTDPATNALIGTPNTAFSMSARGSQSLFLAVSGASPFDGSIAPSFVCDGTSPAPVRSGVNTVSVNLSSSPVMDIIPVGLALPNLDGVVRANRAGGRGVLAVAAVNIGAAGDARISLSGRHAEGGFPGALVICETDAQGQCLTGYEPYLDLRFESGESRTFNARVLTPEWEAIEFAPGSTRMQVDFLERWTGRVAGSTGAAVTSPGPGDLQMSYEEAGRFLVQASFGPNMEEIRAVAQGGIEAWLDAQMALPRSDTHWDYVQRGGPLDCSACEAEWVGAMTESIWHQAVESPDQLRQRMAFALSEIMVVSANSDALGDPRALAAWYDMLQGHAFGNYRDLLEDVARSPAMGHYLSHMRNERENPEFGRIPDENFAREVMQLFSIGLWMLNPDGTRMLDRNGDPIPTYTNEEIGGMARVFTGLSWAGADQGDLYWWGWGFGSNPPWNEPMMMYDRYHESGEKFIINGGYIPAGTSPDDSLDIALDALFNHPSTAPFISRQLIQRFVTSNPSPAYIERVSGVFADNGQGVRGDLGAVLRAILTDEEARSPAGLSDPEFGKLREPVVRLGAWLRGFDARPQPAEDGRYSGLAWINSPVWGLGQNFLYSPSVFNFFRPDYAPPGAITQAGLVAPEFQITHETTVTSYVNFMTGTAGSNFFDWAVQADYSDEMALVGTPSALIERLDVLLAAGQLSDETKALMVEALETVEVGDWEWRNRRLAMAVQLVLVSPEFIVQQ